MFILTLIYSYVTFILFYYLYLYFFISLNMSMKNTSGVPNTFKSFIEKIKLDRLRKQRLRNVKLYPALTHFIWNGLDTIQYQIIQVDCEDMINLIPKMEYSMVIANIPHGFNFQNIGYDSDT